MVQFLNRLNSLILDKIWELEPSRLTRFRRFLYRQLKLIYIVAIEFKEDRLRNQALALSFKLVTSIVPLLAVTFSVLKAFGVQNRLRPALSQFLAPLGEQGEEITHRLIEFVNNMNVRALGAVGLIALFVIVLSLMANIEEAFNQIWGIQKPRRLARRFSDYLSTLLVGPILIFSAIAVTVSLQSHAIVQRILSVEPIGTVAVSLMRILPYVAVWAAFSFLYVFIPNTEVKVRSALLGALVAAILWETVGWGFALFVASSTRYYAVYSSFAVLFVFLLWIYAGWLIVLFGAEVAFAHQNIDTYRRERRTRPASPAERERLALRLMAQIGRSFYFQKPGRTRENLAEELEVSTRLIEEMVSLLKGKKLIVEAEENGTLLPARDLEHIEIGEIIDAVRGRGDREGAFRAREGGNDPVLEVLRDLDDAVRTTLRGRHLKSLVLELSVEPESRLPGDGSP